jgi:hypothetical protein
MAFALQRYCQQRTGDRPFKSVTRIASSDAAKKNMSCKETIRLMCEFIEGRLTPVVARDVSMHLSHCENCTLVLEAAEHTLEIYFDDPHMVTLLERSRVA